MNPELHRQSLRGRRPVRADHRLRTDEKRVRAQSAILIKTPKASLGLSITVFFRTDGFFIRTENTVGAQSAQWPFGDLV